MEIFLWPGIRAKVTASHKKAFVQIKWPRKNNSKEWTGQLKSNKKNLLRVPDVKVEGFTPGRYLFWVIQFRTQHGESVLN